MAPMTTVACPINTLSFFKYFSSLFYRQPRQPQCNYPDYPTCPGNQCAQVQLSYSCPLTPSSSPPGHFEGNMVGGTSAKISKYPYLGQLRKYPFTEPMCGATLFDSLHAVTAGHCIWQRYYLFKSF